tara:strand:- start:195 stop:467 length:273 start_codon:yes stop_codon:yes gene_type:complete
MSLYQGPGEVVELWRLAKNSNISYEVKQGGIEILVLEGSLRTSAIDELSEKDLVRHDWVRLPAGKWLKVVSLEGCKLFVKRGHLPQQSVE